MYTPSQQIIQSGNEYIDNRFPQGEGSPVRPNLDKIYSKYKETSDFYDIQRDQMESLSETLKGVPARDLDYQNQRVIDARDRLAKLYKGKTIKDIRTPEFQSEYHRILSELGTTKARSQSSIEEANEIVKMMDKIPSMQRGRVREFINEQLNLPPDQRMENMIQHVTEDPQFMNGLDFVESQAKNYEESIKTISRERATKHQIINEETKYNPEFGEYNDKGEFELKPSERFIDGLLSHKQFRNLIAGMLPPEQSKALVDQGHDRTYNEALKNMARQYVAGVKSLQPDTSIKSSRAKPQPRASDVKENKHNETVTAVMKGILNKDTTVLQPYGMGQWHSFEFETGPSGRVTGVKAYAKEKDWLGREKKSSEPVFFPISDDPFTSTEKMLETLKFTNQGDKEKVELSDPDSSPTRSSKNAGWSVDGL